MAVSFRFATGASTNPSRLTTNPEVHEDFGMYSYDRALKKVVLRQFHGEGFVNEYTLDSVSTDGKSLQFMTVRIENIAAGWRAKESLCVLSPDEFAETFSLAAPGKNFEVYSETHLKRVVICVPHSGGSHGRVPTAINTSRV